MLAGALGRRVGGDRAGRPAGDGTLIQHRGRRLAPVVDETIVAGGSGHHDLPGVTTVDDRYPGLGPLAGIHAGLLVARSPLVWVVGCDLPDVDPGLAALLCGLAGDVDAVVPRIDSEPQGAWAVYHPPLATRTAGL